MINPPVPQAALEVIHIKSFQNFYGVHSLIQLQANIPKG